MARQSLAYSLESMSEANTRFRLAVIALVTLVTVALVWTMAPFVETAAAAPSEPAPKAPAAPPAWIEPTGTGSVRPEFVSAAVTARSSGQR